MNEIEKLYQIWGTYKPNRNTEIERSLLLHLLGEKQENLAFLISYCAPDGSSLIPQAELYKRLSNAVKRLTVRAYANTLRQNPAYQDKVVENARLNIALKNAEAELEALNKAQSSEESFLSKAQEQQRVLHAEVEQLKQENSKLKEQNNTLSKAIDDYEGIDKEKFDAISTATNLQAKNKALEEQVKWLEGRIKGYQSVEKQILPTLKRTLYTQAYRGKSITLSSPDIEKIVRMYLQGDSKYKISKELAISKCCITKILACDYKTSSSCKKVLRVLRDINGHWTDEKKSKLLNLISLYEEAYRSALERENSQKESMNSSIHDLTEFSEQKRVLTSKKTKGGEL